MVQPRSRIMRLLGLGAVLIALTVGYVMMVRQFDVTALPLERHLGATDKVVPAGEVYIEPLSIDALDDAMQEVFVECFRQGGAVEAVVGNGRQGQLVCRKRRPAQNVREKSSQFGRLGDGLGEILHFCRSSARHIVPPAGRFPLAGRGGAERVMLIVEKTECSATS